MGKIRIEKRFINESIRIRKEYLNSLTELKEKETNISKIKNDIIDAYSLAHVNDIGKELMETKIENLSNDIKTLQNDVEPIILDINNLKTDADRLFEKIQEKYPTITKKDLIESFSPHLQNIDNNYDVF